MRAIFISYRRDDSEGHAGRLFEDLCDRFGKESVFMDVAGIEPGRDFRRAIEQQVASCGVLLAVIGKDWLAVTDESGKRRLDDPNDFVRLETANALKRDIPVIPVLVQQASMPHAEQLPEDLKDLAFRNSVELTHARWSSDVALLITALQRHVDPASEVPSAPALAPTPASTGTGGRAGWVIAPLAALAVGGAAYVAWDRRAPAPGAPALVAAASAPVVADPASAPKPVVDSKPAAPVAAPAPAPAASRHAEKPTIAKPPPAPPASAAAGPAPAPATAPAPAPAPAPVPVPTLTPSPGPLVVAARQEPGLELFGSPGAVSMVTRAIAIKPGTNYVNVTGGEVIRFDVGDKSFVWNFSGTRSSFDLARVAPSSVLDRKVTAYVAPNPLYPKRN